MLAFVRLRFESCPCHFLAGTHGQACSLIFVSLISLISKIGMILPAYFIGLLENIKCGSVCKSPNSACHIQAAVWRCHLHLILAWNCGTQLWMLRVCSTFPSTSRQMSLAAMFQRKQKLLPQLSATILTNGLCLDSSPPLFILIQ